MSNPGASIVLTIGLLGILLSLAQSVANAQENRLGRLFYTPEERSKLDQKRGVIAAPVNTAPQTTIVNGMIVRSGQAPILFIDGKESRGPSSGAALQQQLNQGVPLQTESGQTIAAKPGQIVDLASGRALEAYQLVPGLPAETPTGQPFNPGPTTTLPDTEKQNAGSRRQTQRR